MAHREVGPHLAIQSSMSRLMVLALSLLSGCSLVAADQKACTTVGCVDGLRVDFSFNQKGSYVVEVTLDGVKTTCKATLPLSNPPPTPCDREGVYLTLSGSALPADQQSIGGLLVTATTNNHVTVRVSRDGTILGAIDRTITWTTTPGPNGPGCEPAECRSSSMTL